MQTIPILDRDEYFLVVDKPSRLLVHPDKKQSNETGEYLPNLPDIPQLD
jgi:23S rRNA-/tRNA-specific pseudouridylate synthase